MTENNRLDATFMVDVEPQKELLQPDVQVGPYVVKNEIGCGAMGAVYRAVHTKLKRTVALKLLSNSLNTNERQLARFQREMEAIGRLDHPNIVRATDAGEYKSIHYLVMEYVNGLDVQRLLVRVGRFDYKVSCEIARQTALGLQHIYDNDLVHRDIKPSNLLVSEAGVVKILDLGIAMLRHPEDDGLTIDGALMGTPDFMAPEQIDGSPNVDIRADLYSLGCTLYMLLSGHPPFSGPEYEPHVAKLIAQRCDRPQSLATFLPDLPVDLSRVVDRLMAKEPRDRFQTPGEVAEVLAPWAHADALKQLAASIVEGMYDENNKVRADDRPKPVRPSTSRSRFRRNVLRAGFPIGMGLLLALAILNDEAYQSRKDQTQTMPVTTRQRPRADRVPSTPRRSWKSSTPDSIADSLHRVAGNTDHIRQDARKIAESGQQLRTETQRIADTLDELRAAFQAAAEQSGVLADPKSAGELYHNARLHQLQGNNTLARQSYLQLFDLGTDFVDVHDHFQQFLILQEGRAGARVVYRKLTSNSHNIVRRYAQSLLEELPERTERLGELTREDPNFAPAHYALSVCYSSGMLGRQSLTDQVTEKEMLTKFLLLHQQGHLLRHFLDQSEAATMIHDAQQRLASLQSVDSEVLKRPVAVLVSKHRRGWMLTFRIAETVREISYRLDSKGEFQSTGFADHVDPRTGERIPNSYAQLPLSELHNMVEVRYVDIHGKQQGPFLLTFDPVSETLQDTKRRLELTKSAWLRFGTGAHANRLYFSHLAAHRDGIAQVRYAIDSDIPATVHVLPAIESGEMDRLHVEVSPDARFAVVQLTFRDGSMSEVVRIDR